MLSDKDKKEYKRLYYLKNKERLLKYNNDRYNTHKDDIKMYYQDNKSKIEKRKMEYRKNNLEKLRNKKCEYNARYYKHNPSAKLIKNIRSRINGAIKNGYGKKAYKTLDLLGCDWDNARQHLEFQFTEGMTWDNYGEWHVDHIRPCASFDLTNPKEQKECFNYKNLQPLWAEDNLSKGDKYLVGE